MVFLTNIVFLILLLVLILSLYIKVLLPFIDDFKKERLKERAILDNYLKMLNEKNKVYKHKTNKFVIKAYLGLTGSGKTLSAVQNEVIPALEMGRDVWVNIWLNYKHPNLHYFEEWEDLHDVKNSLIFVDEVGDLLDPYNWADYSKLDKNVIRYHRKRFNDLIITSQDISQISKSIRIFIHIWVLCQNGSNFLTDFFYKLFFRSDVAVVKTLDFSWF